MPVYDYKCQEHGLFHELAGMDKAHLPCPCPQCGRSSARVVMIPPEVLAMAPNKRKAEATNEAARHQPRFSTPDSRAEAQEKKIWTQQHGSCGCKSHSPEADRSALSQKAVYLADGSKIFPSQRPWMISH